MARGPKQLDLVLEGGGVKGIGLLGAAAVLLERGYTFERIAGASAGAITATLLASGYTPEEIFELTLALDLRTLEDPTRAARVPFVGKPLSLVLHKGVNEGDVFLRRMTKLLEAKGKRTFADLIHPDFAGEAEQRFRYRALVIASDVTCRRLLTLPPSAGHLGMEPADMSIATAVRMSMSLPFFYKPVRHVTSDPIRKEHLLVDGGLLSNFPVETFDVPHDPRWWTFGLLLVEDDPGLQLGARLPAPARERILFGGLIEYGKSMLLTMFEARDRRYVEEHNFVRTIPIRTLGVGTTEFGLSRERAKKLYESGREAATKFLDELPDFDDYKKEFRTGKPPSRRERLVAELRGDGG
jgi:NTE family protein